jgi:hypothetical protein
VPISKKRKKQEKKRRPRDGDERAPEPRAAEPESRGGGGLLSRMRGGFQGVAGTGPKKPESLLSKIITWALVALVAYFLARRFGIIR